MAIKDNKDSYASEIMKPTEFKISKMRRQKNYAIMLIIVFVIILIYAVSIIKLSS